MSISAPRQKLDHAGYESYNGLTNNGGFPQSVPKVKESEVAKGTARTIEELTQAALQELESLDGLELLEQWRVAYLGRRGQLTSILRGLALLDLEQRRVVGALGNRAKLALEERLAQRTREINEAQLARAGTQERIDTTLPGRPPTTGRLHPTTQVIREICNAFASMGFSIVEGPEVEWDRYNFEMLNIPQGPPGAGYVEYSVGGLPRRGGALPHAAAHPHLPNAGPGDGKHPTPHSSGSPRGSVTATRPPTPPTSGISTRLKVWR